MALSYFNRLPFDVVKSYIFPTLLPLELLDILSSPNLFGLSHILQQDLYLEELRKQVGRQCSLNDPRFNFTLLNPNSFIHYKKIVEQFIKQYPQATLIVGKTLLPFLPLSTTPFLLPSVSLPSSISISSLSSSPPSTSISSLLPFTPLPSSTPSPVSIRQSVWLDAYPQYLFVNLKNCSPYNLVIYYQDSFYHDVLPYQFIKVLKAFKITHWESFSELFQDPTIIPWISTIPQISPISPSNSLYSLRPESKAQFATNFHQCRCLAKLTDSAIETMQIDNVTLTLIHQDLTKKLVRTFYTDGGFPHKDSDIQLTQLIELLAELRESAQSLIEFTIIKSISICITNDWFIELIDYLYNHYQSYLKLIVNRKFIEIGEPHYLLPTACADRNITLVELLLKLNPNLAIDDGIVLPCLLRGRGCGHPADQNVSEILQLLLDAGFQPTTFEDPLDDRDFLEYCSDSDIKFDYYPSNVKHLILAHYPDFPTQLHQLQIEIISHTTNDSDTDNDTDDNGTNDDDTNDDDTNDGDTESG